jgi:hypothetical protein
VNLDEFERRKRIKSAKERAKNKPVPKARQRGRSPKLRRYIDNLRQFGDYLPPTEEEPDNG